MILQVEVHGFFATNTYFYIDDETNHGFLIDPGAEPEKLLRIIDEKNFTIEKILLTHGHFDHIGAVNDIRAKLDIPVVMHRDGKIYAENADWNLSAHFGLNLTLDDVTYLDDGAEIGLSVNPNFKVKLISVAGHTTDGAIYYAEKDGFAFVGDSIFLGSYGRTDFPGGDEKTLFKNIKTKIFALPDNIILLSGHSEPTNVAAEKTRSWFK